MNDEFDTLIVAAQQCLKVAKLRVFTGYKGNAFCSIAKAFSQGINSLNW